MAPTKVFVGNLSFKTREAELAQEFAAAGRVLTANIITRGPRSLGYGFVELESEEEASKAVSMLNKKEIHGRAINVEVARPRTDRPEVEVQGEGAPPRRSNRGRGSGRRGRGRGGREGEQREGNEGGQPAEQPAQPQQRRRQRAAAPTAAGSAAEQPAEGGEQPASGGRRRGARARRGRGGGGNRRPEGGPREESDTTLFVANLPFNLTDEQLKTEFSGSGLAVKSAHVVVRVTGRSKGYGFVEYETKADQGRALSTFEKKEVDGRALIVKIALKDNRPAPDAAGEAQQPAHQ